jgi:hypothetical protein
LTYLIVKHIFKTTYEVYSSSTPKACDESWEAMLVIHKNSLNYVHVSNGNGIVEILLSKLVVGEMTIWDIEHMLDA